MTLGRLKSKLLSNIISIGLIGGTLLVVFTPDIVIIKKFAGYSVHFMLALLLAGLLFLILRQQRLMLISFACCAILCIYFKKVANINIIPPLKTSEPTFRLAHFQTSDLTTNWADNLKFIAGEQIDIISFIEITPEWELVLKEFFETVYPYHIYMVRIDYLGSCIFSRFPIITTDTFYYKQNPNLSVSFRITDHYSFDLICSNTQPPLFRRSYEELRGQLNIIAENVMTNPGPTLTVGNYNLDQFSTELQMFRSKAGLSDSRKSLYLSLNHTPTNHIFYSNHLECLSFSNLFNPVSLFIGIVGEYQFKNSMNGSVKVSGG
jgi:hypothetical protein